MLLKQHDVQFQNLKRFIFSGSVEEYGIQKKFPTKETAELHAASPYAVAKIATEKHLEISLQSIQISFYCF